MQDTQQEESDGGEAQADATALEGTWQGALSVSGVTLGIVFHLDRAEDGSWEATMDSPDQGATGIPISDVSFKDGQVQLDAAAIGGTYKGTLSEDGEHIEGTWSQGGSALPLDLERVRAEDAHTITRPQNPKPPFPYTSEAVKFAGGQPTAGTDMAVTLAGTLTLPKTAGPHPAVVLLTGSGPQDRDETLMGHKPFLVLADFLSRHGVAVLRFDDRGVAESTGVFQDATIADFTTDALAAADFLSTRDDIDQDAIGLLGHSEGANVAARASLADKKVDFLVLLAPTGVPGTELLARQNKMIFEGIGMSAEGASAYEKQMLKILEEIAKKPLDKPLSAEDKKTIYAQFKAAAEAMAPEDRKYYGPLEPEAFAPVLDAMVTQLTSPWMRSFLAMTPAETFKKVNVPTLALFGGKDVQVPAKQNAAPLRKQLPKRARATVTVLDGLNHLFQPATTGLPMEYASIETTLAPEALNAILDWLTQHGWAQQAGAPAQPPTATP